MDTIENLIARLDNWLRVKRPKDYRRLQPGLSLEEVEKLEKSLGLSLPAEFKAFYMWKNGQRFTPRDRWTTFTRFTDNVIFMPANNIIKYSEVMNQLLEAGDFDLVNWWHPKWVPFMEDGNSDYYCLDLAGSFTGKPGQIIQFWHDYERRKVLHESFSKWLETLVTALERDLLVLDDRRYYPGEGYNELYQEINPGYPLKYDAG